MDYQAKRDAPPPVPYTPPQSEVQPLQPAAVDLVAVARPIVGLSIVGGIVCVVASGFAAACAATFAFVSANAAWFIGGALVVGWASGLGGSRSGTDSKETAKNANGGQTINVTVNVAGESVNVSKHG